MHSLFREYSVCMLGCFKLTIQTPTKNNLYFVNLIWQYALIGRTTWSNLRCLWNTQSSIWNPLSFKHIKHNNNLPQDIHREIFASRKVIDWCLLLKWPSENAESGDSWFELSCNWFLIFFWTPPEFFWHSGGPEFLKNQNSQFGIHFHLLFDPRLPRQ